MPELPEVETIKKTLEHLVIGKTIEDITVNWPKIIQHPDDIKAFTIILKGQTIQRMDRRGKFLLFYLDTHVLISHLRMEGKYGVFGASDSLDKHTHVVFHFTNGEQLRYKDVRKFGTMHVYSIGEEFDDTPIAKLGPEPFDASFTDAYLLQRLSRTNRTIKTVLLDQTIVTGLGNIYVDEALFRSCIHPLRVAKELSKAEVKVLRQEIIDTLQEAVDQGGTTIRSYVNTQGQIGMFQHELYVYGRESEACRRCLTPITKMKVGGRGTHVCLQCQHLYK
ncbi:DNA-formamidopyrimidine glycosylase [Pontibacillus litoralis]|uniref:Formamidopyrimidine-DNA glycosylase n=1 Tax=Pontibacillus litoralis JSM 072002 TaxID=1385512 RepID=A0A0A5GAQ1_9BACI|nr:DNA-formamidopyrimidine glycosylase [Pontibacillus litoralis]KGX89084.1 5-hydroxymethyluracil DNA glycosylase [Pontibacillus litoralis JSM 072002]